MKDTPRCGWCLGHNDYIRYHDQEWGVPVKDDKKLFEFLTLESFQAGLSWITILRKREHFRKVLDGFDYKKIANYNDQDIDRLIQDKGIIRNRLKIKAVISNAKAFMDVQNEFGSFSTFIWSYVNNIPLHNAWTSTSEIPSNTPLSDQISKDLKQRGFKYVGSTIVYAHMQATGIVNDHLINCFRYKELIEVG